MSTNEEMLEELREIRKLLTPAPAPEPPSNILAEFKDFISKYKVLGLAVAFILGLQLAALVQTLVSALIMPIVEIFLPADTPWETITFGVLRVGEFFGALLTFIIVAFVIFLIMKIAVKVGIE